MPECDTLLCVKSAFGKHLQNKLANNAKFWIPD